MFHCYVRTTCHEYLSLSFSFSHSLSISLKEISILYKNPRHFLTVARIKLSTARIKLSTSQAAPFIIGYYFKKHNKSLAFEKRKY